MAHVLEFFRFYFMAGVYILAGVLAASAVVALIEKAFGLNTTPRSINFPQSETSQKIDRPRSWHGAAATALVANV
jgi:hypothetical protein